MSAHVGGLIVKRIFSCLLLQFCICFLLCCSAHVNAFGDSNGFEIECIPAGKQEDFIRSIQISIQNINVETHSIVCFDVNENGMIALGFDTSPQKTICIYNSSGDFQFGYTFYCSGSFGVGWHKDDLIIYFIRSDIAAAFDKDAQCVAIAEITDTVDNNTYWNQTVFAKKRVVGDKTYTLESDWGILATAYSRLRVSDVSGDEQILFDVGQYDLASGVFALILIVMTVIFAVIAIFKKRNCLGQG